MKAETYFKKNECIYGLSYLEGCTLPFYKVYYFDDLQEAVKWLNTDEQKFRTRELCSESKAIEAVGKKRVEDSHMIIEL